MMLLLSSALSECYYEIFRCTQTDSAATVSPRLNLVLFKENNACGFVCPLIWWNSSHFSSQQGKDIYQLTGSSAGKKNIPSGLHATLWLLLPWCAKIIHQLPRYRRGTEQVPHQTTQTHLCGSWGLIYSITDPNRLGAWRNYSVRSVRKTGPFQRLHQQRATTLFWAEILWSSHFSSG